MPDTPTPPTDRTKPPRQGDSTTTKPTTAQTEAGHEPGKPQQQLAGTPDSSGSHLPETQVKPLADSEVTKRKDDLNNLLKDEHPDAAKIQNLLTGIPEEQRKKIVPDNFEDTIKNKFKSDDDGSRLDQAKILDVYRKPDDRANFAGDIHVFLVDKDKGQSCSQIIDYLSTLAPDQMKIAKEDYQKQYGQSLEDALTKESDNRDQDFGNRMPDWFKKGENNQPSPLDLLLKGHGDGGRNADENVILANAGAKGGDSAGMSLIAAALGGDTEAAKQARQKLCPDGDISKMDSTLKSAIEKSWDGDKRSIVEDLVSSGSTLRFVLGEKNTTAAQVSQALQSASQQERDQFRQGALLAAQNKPEGQLTAAEKQALDFYKNVDRQLKDVQTGANIEHKDDEGESSEQIVNEVDQPLNGETKPSEQEQQKQRFAWENQLAFGTTGSSIANGLISGSQDLATMNMAMAGPLQTLTPEQFKDLQGQSADMQAILRSQLGQLNAPGQDKALDLLNQRLSAPDLKSAQSVQLSFADSIKFDPSASNTISSLQYLSADEAAAYHSNDPAMRGLVDGAVGKLTGLDQSIAQRLVGSMAQTGKPPQVDDVTSALIDSRRTDITIGQSIQDIQKAMALLRDPQASQSDKDLLREIQSGTSQNPAAKALIDMVNKIGGDDGQIGGESVKDLITNGSLNLSTQWDLHLDKSYVLSQLMGKGTVPDDLKSKLSSDELEIAQHVATSKPETVKDKDGNDVPLNKPGQLNTVDLARLVALEDPKENASLTTQLEQRLLKMDPNHKVDVFKDYADTYQEVITVDVVGKVSEDQKQNMRDALSLTKVDAQTDLAAGLERGANFDGGVEDKDHSALNSFEAVQQFTQVVGDNAAGYFKNFTPEQLQALNSTLCDAQDRFAEARKTYDEAHPGFWKQVEDIAIDCAIAAVACGVGAVTGGVGGVLVGALLYGALEQAKKYAIDGQEITPMGFITDTVTGVVVVGTGGILGKVAGKVSQGLINGVANRFLSTAVKDATQTAVRATLADSVSVGATAATQDSIMAAVRTAYTSAAAMTEGQANKYLARTLTETLTKSLTQQFGKDAAKEMAPKLAQDIIANFNKQGAQLAFSSGGTQLAIGTGRTVIDQSIQNVVFTGSNVFLSPVEAAIAANPLTGSGQTWDSWESLGHTLKKSVKEFVDPTQLGKSFGTGIAQQFIFHHAGRIKEKIGVDTSIVGRTAERIRSVPGFGENWGFHRYQRTVAEPSPDAQFTTLANESDLIARLNGEDAHLVEPLASAITNSTEVVNTLASRKDLPALFESHPELAIGLAGRSDLASVLKTHSELSHALNESVKTNLRTAESLLGCSDLQAVLKNNPDLASSITTVLKTNPEAAVSLAGNAKLAEVLTGNTEIGTQFTAALKTNSEVVKSLADNPNLSAALKIPEVKESLSSAVKTDSNVAGILSRNTDLPAVLKNNPELSGPFVAAVRAEPNVARALAENTNLSAALKSNPELMAPLTEALKTNAGARDAFVVNSDLPKLLKENPELVGSVRSAITDSAQAASAFATRSDLPAVLNTRSELTEVLGKVVESNHEVAAALSSRSDLWATLNSRPELTATLAKSVETNPDVASILAARADLAFTLTARPDLAISLAKSVESRPETARSLASNPDLAKIMLTSKELTTALTDAARKYEVAETLVNAQQPAALAQLINQTPALAANIAGSNVPPGLPPLTPSLAKAIEAKPSVITALSTPEFSPVLADILTNAPELVINLAKNSEGSAALANVISDNPTFARDLLSKPELVVVMEQIVRESPRLASTIATSREFEPVRSVILASDSPFAQIIRAKQSTFNTDPTNVAPPVVPINRSSVLARTSAGREGGEISSLKPDTNPKSITNPSELIPGKHSDAVLNEASKRVAAGEKTGAAPLAVEPSFVLPGSESSVTNKPSGQPAPNSGTKSPPVSPVSTSRISEEGGLEPQTPRTSGVHQGQGAAHQSGHQGGTEPAAHTAVDPNAPISVDPNAPISIDPNAPISVDPNAPISVDPNAPISIDPNAPISVDPNAPISVDPNAPISVQTTTNTTPAERAPGSQTESVAHEMANLRGRKPSDVDGLYRPERDLPRLSSDTARALADLNSTLLAHHEMVSDFVSSALSRIGNWEHIVDKAQSRATANQRTADLQTVVDHFVERLNENASEQNARKISSCQLRAASPESLGAATAKFIEEQNGNRIILLAEDRLLDASKRPELISDLYHELTHSSLRTSDLPQDRAREQNFEQRFSQSEKDYAATKSQLDRLQSASLPPQFNRAIGELRQRLEDINRFREALYKDYMGSQRGEFDERMPFLTGELAHLECEAQLAKKTSQAQAEMAQIGETVSFKHSDWRIDEFDPLSEQYKLCSNNTVNATLAEIRSHNNGRWPEAVGEQFSSGEINSGLVYVGKNSDGSFRFTRETWVNKDQLAEQIRVEPNTTAQPKGRLSVADLSPEQTRQIEALQQFCSEHLPGRAYEFDETQLWDVRDGVIGTQINRNHVSKTPEGFELFDSDMMNRYKFDNQMRLVRIENLLQNQGKTTGNFGQEFSYDGNGLKSVVFDDGSTLTRNGKQWSLTNRVPSGASETHPWFFGKIEVTTYGRLNYLSESLYHSVNSVPLEHSLVSLLSQMRIGDTPLSAHPELYAGLATRIEHDNQATKKVYGRDEQEVRHYVEILSDQLSHLSTSEVLTAAKVWEALPNLPVSIASHPQVAELLRGSKQDRDIQSALLKVAAAYNRVEIASNLSGKNFADWARLPENQNFLSLQFDAALKDILAVDPVSGAQRAEGELIKELTNDTYLPLAILSRARDKDNPEHLHLTTSQQRAINDTLKNTDQPFVMLRSLSPQQFAANYDRFLARTLSTSETPLVTKQDIVLILEQKRGKDQELQTITLPKGTKLPPGVELHGENIVSGLRAWNATLPDGTSSKIIGKQFKIDVKTGGTIGDFFGGGQSRSLPPSNQKGVVLGTALFGRRLLEWIDIREKLAKNKMKGNEDLSLSEYKKLFDDSTSFFPTSISDKPLLVDYLISKSINGKSSDTLKFIVDHWPEMYEHLEASVLPKALAASDAHPMNEAIFSERLYAQRSAELRRPIEQDIARQIDAEFKAFELETLSKPADAFFSERELAFKQLQEQLDHDIQTARTELVAAQLTFKDALTNPQYARFPAIIDAFHGSVLKAQIKIRDLVEGENARLDSEKRARVLEEIAARESEISAHIEAELGLRPDIEFSSRELSAADNAIAKLIKAEIEAINELPLETKYALLDQAKAQQFARPGYEPRNHKLAVFAADSKGIVISDRVHRPFTSEEYQRIEERWYASQSRNIPSEFSSSRVFRPSTAKGELEGSFLHPADEQGLWLGDTTFNCQHPGGYGAEMAWHTQENGYFFVLRNKAGEVIGQSAVRVVGNKVCFDNAEAIGYGERMQSAQEVYKAVAKHLIDSGYDVVTLGIGQSDLDLAGLHPANGSQHVEFPESVGAPNSRDIPIDAPDSAQQVILAAKPTVRAATLEDMAGMQRIANQYPPGLQFVPFGEGHPDSKAMVMLNETGEIRGYAAYEKDNLNPFSEEGRFLINTLMEHGVPLESPCIYISDLAVYRDPNDPQNLKKQNVGPIESARLIKQLFEELQTVGNLFRADMRYNTSRPLLNYATRRSLIRVLGDEPNSQTVNGEVFHKVVFDLSPQQNSTATTGKSPTSVDPNTASPVQPSPSVPHNPAGKAVEARNEQPHSVAQTVEIKIPDALTQAGLADHMPRKIGTDSPVEVASGEATYAGNKYKKPDGSFENQDSHIVLHEDGQAPVHVVADGVGGQGDGAAASKIITELFKRAYAEHPPSELSSKDAKEWLDQRVLEANEAIAVAKVRGYRVADGSTVKLDEGAASTVVATIVDKNGNVHASWAGDSRLYLMREGQLFYISNDHSLYRTITETARRGTVQEVREILHSADGAFATKYPQFDAFLTAQPGGALLHPKTIQEVERIAAQIAPGNVIVNSISGSRGLSPETLGSQSSKLAQEGLAFDQYGALITHPGDRFLLTSDAVPDNLGFGDQRTTPVVDWKSQAIVEALRKSSTAHDAANNLLANVIYGRNETGLPGYSQLGEAGLSKAPAQQQGHRLDNAAIAVFDIVKPQSEPANAVGGSDRSGSGEIIPDSNAKSTASAYLNKDMTAQESLQAVQTAAKAAGYIDPAEFAITHLSPEEIPQFVFAYKSIDSVLHELENRIANHQTQHSQTWLAEIHKARASEKQSADMLQRTIPRLPTKFSREAVAFSRDSVRTAQFIEKVQSHIARAVAEAPALRDKIETGSVLLECKTTSVELKEALAKQGLEVFYATADSAITAYHWFLTVKGPEGDIIIEPTIGQFIPECRGRVEVLTRENLRTLVNAANEAGSFHAPAGPLAEQHPFEMLWGNASLHQNVSPLTEYKFSPGKEELTLPTEIAKVVQAVKHLDDATAIENFANWGAQQFGFDFPTLLHWAVEYKDLTGLAKPGTSEVWTSVISRLSKDREIYLGLERSGYSLSLKNELPTNPDYTPGYFYALRHLSDAHEISDAARVMFARNPEKAAAFISAMLSGKGNEFHSITSQMVLAGNPRNSKAWSAALREQLEHLELNRESLDGWLVEIQQKEQLRSTKYGIDESNSTNRMIELHETTFDPLVSEHDVGFTLHGIDTVIDPVTKKPVENSSPIDNRRISVSRQDMRYLESVYEQDIVRLKKVTDERERLKALFTLINGKMRSQEQRRQAEIESRRSAKDRDQKTQTLTNIIEKLERGEALDCREASLLFKAFADKLQTDLNKDQPASRSINNPNNANVRLQRGAIFKSVENWNELANHHMWAEARVGSDLLVFDFGTERIPAVHGTPYKDLYDLNAPVEHRLDLMRMSLAEIENSVRKHDELQRRPEDLPEAGDHSQAEPIHLAESGLGQPKTAAGLHEDWSTLKNELPTLDQTEAIAKIEQMVERLANAPIDSAKVIASELFGSIKVFDDVAQALIIDKLVEIVRAKEMKFDADVSHRILRDLRDFQAAHEDVQSLFDTAYDKLSRSQIDAVDFVNEQLTLLSWLDDSGFHGGDSEIALLLLHNARHHDLDQMISQLPNREQQSEFRNYVHRVRQLADKLLEENSSNLTLEQRADLLIVSLGRIFTSESPKLLEKLNESLLSDRNNFLEIYRSLSEHEQAYLQKAFKEIGFVDQRFTQASDANVELGLSAQQNRLKRIQLKAKLVTADSELGQFYSLRLRDLQESIFLSEKLETFSNLQKEFPSLYDSYELKKQVIYDEIAVHHHKVCERQSKNLARAAQEYGLRLQARGLEADLQAFLTDLPPHLIEKALSAIGQRAQHLSYSSVEQQLKNLRAELTDAHIRRVQDRTRTIERVNIIAFEPVQANEFLAYAFAKATGVGIKMHILEKSSELPRDLRRGMVFGEIPEGFRLEGDWLTLKNSSTLAELNQFDRGVNLVDAANINADPEGFTRKLGIEYDGAPARTRLTEGQLRQIDDLIGSMPGSPSENQALALWAVYQHANTLLEDPALIFNRDSLQIYSASDVVENLHLLDNYLLPIESNPQNIVSILGTASRFRTESNKDSDHAVAYLHERFRKNSNVLRIGHDDLLKRTDLAGKTILCDKDSLQSGLEIKKAIEFLHPQLLALKSKQLVIRTIAARSDGLEEVNALIASLNEKHPECPIRLLHVKDNQFALDDSGSKQIAFFYMCPNNNKPSVQTLLYDLGIARSKTADSVAKSESDADSSHPAETAAEQTERYARAGEVSSRLIDGFEILGRESSQSDKRILHADISHERVAAALQKIESTAGGRFEEMFGTDFSTFFAKNLDQLRAEAKDARDLERRIAAHNEKIEHFTWWFGEVVKSIAEDYYPISRREQIKSNQLTLALEGGEAANQKLSAALAQQELGCLGLSLMVKLAADHLNVGADGAGAIMYRGAHEGVVRREGEPFDAALDHAWTEVPLPGRVLRDQHGNWIQPETSLIFDAEQGIFGSFHRDLAENDSSKLFLPQSEVIDLFRGGKNVENPGIDLPELGDALKPDVETLFVGRMSLQLDIENAIAKAKKSGASVILKDDDGVVVKINPDGSPDRLMLPQTSSSSGLFKKGRNSVKEQLDEEYNFNWLEADVDSVAAAIQKALSEDNKADLHVWRNRLSRGVNDLLRGPGHLDTVSRLLFDDANVARELSVKNANLVRVLASKTDILGHAINKFAAEALEPHTAGSISALVEKYKKFIDHLDHYQLTKPFENCTDVVYEVFKCIGDQHPAGIEELLSELKSKALRLFTLPDREFSINTAYGDTSIAMAYGLAHGNRELYENLFLEPLRARLNDSSLTPEQHNLLDQEIHNVQNRKVPGSMDLSREQPERLSSLLQQRTGESIKDLRLELEQTLLGRNQDESTGSQELLAKSFAEVFSKFTTEEIAKLDANMRELRRLVTSSEDADTAHFAQLSEADHVDALWSILVKHAMRGKGTAFGDHEGTIKICQRMLSQIYSPERIKAIADLTDRYNEFDEILTATSDRTKKTESLAASFRGKNQTLSALLLNIADRRMHGNISQKELDELLLVAKAVQDRVYVINDKSIPYAVNEPPQKPGLHTLSEFTAVLAHRPKNIASFLRYLDFFTGRDRTLAASIFTPDSMIPYLESSESAVLKQQPTLVILLDGAGASERTAFTYRDDCVMATGWKNDADDYAHLVDMWSKNPREVPPSKSEYEPNYALEVAEYSTRLANEMNDRIRKVFKDRSMRITAGESKYPYLEHIRDYRSQHRLYSYEDVVRHDGIDSAYAASMRAIVSAFTTKEPKLGPIAKHFGKTRVKKDGAAIDYNNEATVNNPSAAGVGIITRGRPIFFEGITSTEHLRELNIEGEPPSWLTLDSFNYDAFTIPKEIWSVATEMELPIVVLDQPDLAATAAHPQTLGITRASTVDLNSDRPNPLLLDSWAQHITELRSQDNTSASAHIEMLADKLNESSLSDVSVTDKLAELLTVAGRLDDVSFALGVDKITEVALNRKLSVDAAFAAQIYDRLNRLTRSDNDDIASLAKESCDRLARLSSPAD